MRILPAARMLAVVSAGFAVLVFAAGTTPKDMFTGEKAFEDTSKVQPGMFRKITAGDLPKPYATKSAGNALKVVPRPADAWPKAPPGFKVELFATGLSFPRLIRKAPNGDLFLADAANHSQNNSGTIKVLRGITKEGTAGKISTFVSGLNTPFGIAFYPPGPNPQWVYIGST